jgi:hypothetical protein
MREKVLEEKFGTLPDLSYFEKMIQIEFQIQSTMIIRRLLALCSCCFILDFYLGYIHNLSAMLVKLILQTTCQKLMTWDLRSSFKKFNPNQNPSSSSFLR